MEEAFYPRERGISQSVPPEERACVFSNFSRVGASALPPLCIEIKAIHYEPRNVIQLLFVRGIKRMDGPPSGRASLHSMRALNVT